MVIFRNITFVVCFLLPTLFNTGIALKAYANSSTATAQAEVVSPLETKTLRPLKFGKIHPGVKGGKISIDPKNGQRHFEGTTYSLSGKIEKGQRAAFQVTGQKNRSYSITLPDEIYIKEKSGHGPSVIVTNFHAFTKNRQETGNIGTLNNSGHDKFYVGGDLLLTASSYPGFYSARIDVLVHYQ